MCSSISERDFVNAFFSQEFDHPLDSLTMFSMQNQIETLFNHAQFEEGVQVSLASLKELCAARKPPSEEMIGIIQNLVFISLENLENNCEGASNSLVELIKILIPYLEDERTCDDIFFDIVHKYPHSLRAIRVGMYQMIGNDPEKVMTDRLLKSIMADDYLFDCEDYTPAEAVLAYAVKSLSQVKEREKVEELLNTVLCWRNNFPNTIKFPSDKALLLLCTGFKTNSVLIKCYPLINSLEGDITQELKDLTIDVFETNIKYGGEDRLLALIGSVEQVQQRIALKKSTIAFFTYRIILQGLDYSKEKKVFLELFAQKEQMFSPKRHGVISRKISAMEVPRRRTRRGRGRLAAKSGSAEISIIKGQ